MNKYLLLRDNKESGPYTTPELIAKGIKPYDLVWLEGKSAAWRYPSEVDELKAHAPAIEEQPYDRFYKKPEEKEEKEKRSAPNPVIAEVKKAETGTRKVYINFPGGQSRLSGGVKPVAPSIGEEAPAMQAAAVAPLKTEMKESSSTVPKETFVPKAAAVEISNDTTANANAGIATTERNTAGTERKLFYGVVAACFVLLVIISILIVNYGNQRSNMKELSSRLQQMEKRQNEQNQSAKEALASRHFSAPAEEPANEVPVAENAAVITGPAVTSANTVHPAVTRSSDQPVIVVPAAKPVAKVQAATAAPEEKAGSPTTVSPKNDLLSQVSVKPNKFKTGLFGGVVDLQFILSNNSPKTLQRVTIEVKYFSPEKKLVKTQTVYFENVAPNSQPVLDVPKTNRGVTINYAITDIKS